MRLIKSLALVFGLSFFGCQNKKTGLQDIITTQQFDYDGPIREDFPQVQVRHVLLAHATVLLGDWNGDGAYDCNAQVYMSDENEDGKIDFIRSDATCSKLDFRMNTVVKDMDFDGKPDVSYSDFENEREEPGPDGFIDVERNLSHTSYNVQTMNQLYNILKPR